jgi:hypothetical protein
MNKLIPIDTNVLKLAREKTRQLCIAVALANTPENVTVVKPRRGLSGYARYAEGLLVAPRPFTRKALYIFLHECAHFALHAPGKGPKQPRHVEEMEAEQWAHQKMREAGIAVPRAMTKSAKAYVRRKVHQARRRGAKKIDKGVLAWLNQSKSAAQSPR